MEIPRSRKFFAFKKPSTYTMPHRCVAGGCSNTAKDGVSLHGWPTNAQLARQWTNAVRNTRANFNQTASSKLCSSHFSDDSFETQSVIAHSLGLKMKKILKPDAVPTIFHNCPPQKRQRREHSTDRTEGYSSPAYGSRAQQFPKQPRGAYRKREAARVRIADYLKLALFCKCNPQRTNVNLITLFFFWKIVAEHETLNSAVSYEGSVEGLERARGAESLPSAQEAATQTQSHSKNVSVQFRTKSTAKGKFLKLCCVFAINMVLQKKPFVYKRFGYHFPAVQITVPTKGAFTRQSKNGTDPTKTGTVRTVFAKKQ